MTIKLKSKLILLKGCQQSLLKLLKIGKMAQFKIFELTKNQKLETNLKILLKVLDFHILILITLFSKER
jgi:hypothetical protein